MSCLEKGQATLLSSPDKKRIQPAIDSLMRTDDMICQYLLQQWQEILYTGMTGTVMLYI